MSSAWMTGCWMGMKFEMWVEAYKVQCVDTKYAPEWSLPWIGGCRQRKRESDLHKVCLAPSIKYGMEGPFYTNWN